MKFSAALILVSGMIANSAALAGNSACAAYAGRLFQSAKGCQCGVNLGGKFRLESSPDSIVRAPENMPLIAVCNYAKGAVGGYFNGSFYFSGSALVTGELKRVASDSQGEELTFSALDEASLKLLPSPSSIEAELRVPERPGKKILPSLTPARDCVKAKATILIKDMQLEVDDGTDNGGTNLTNFEVVKLGKLEKCAG